MDIIVNSVGDANCILIKSDGESMMIDCGVKNGCYASIKEQFIGAQFLAADYFLLSHYHDDHYDLLRKLPICKKSVLKKFYYPIIPKISASSITMLNNSAIVSNPTPSKIKIGRNKVSCCVLAQCFLLMKVLHNSVIPLKNYGSPTANILGLLDKRCDRINGNEALYMGKKIKLGNEEYEVIWPPRQFALTKDGNGNDIEMPKGIVENIKNIFDELNKNKNLKQIWDKLEEYTQDDTINSESFFVDDNQKSNIDDKEFKSIINAASKIPQATKDTIVGYVKKIANSISICLYRENEFLFLGDLEDADIKRCIEQKFGSSNDEIKVKYFITPHHGTHWNSILQKRIKAENAIISIGESLYKVMKLINYKNVCKHLYITFNHGDFICCNESLIFDIMQNYNMLSFYNSIATLK